MRHNWNDAEVQVKGRPDAEAESVSITTMHLAQGLEWPIVPINPPTELYDDATFLHRRSDDTVHFKLLDQASADYEVVKVAEPDQLRRERVRLWYVAITRACDLLLLPRQSERKSNDWMSVVDLRLDELPLFDIRAIADGPAPPDIHEPRNGQNDATWAGEAAVIAAARRSVVCAIAAQEMRRYGSAAQADMKCQPMRRRRPIATRSSPMPPADRKLGSAGIAG